jgi:hypothetical protein
MAAMDFTKPMIFLNTLEPFALSLNCALIALRDEANFRDEGDPAIVSAAAIFSSMLEDAHAEVVTLGAQLEQRALGKTDS